MAAALQILPSEQDSAARQLELNTTPEVKDAVISGFRNVGTQFQDLQKTSAVFPVSKEDLYYSAEDDWFYQKDGVTDSSVLARFQSAGSQITKHLEAQHAKQATPLRLEGRRVGLKELRAGPQEPSSDSEQGGLWQSVRWLVKNVVLPGALLVAGTHLWRTLPSAAVQLPHTIQEEVKERSERLNNKQLGKLLDEISEVVQGDPQNWPLVQAWADSGTREWPKKWLQQQEGQEGAQQQEEEDEDEE